MRTSFALGLAVAATLLAGCSSDPKVEWANDRGGVISYDGSSEVRALKKADEICGWAGRKARVSSLNPDLAKVTYDCVE
ncbi:hypothetical protein [Phaeospirillum tilakii]|uniref:Lipoprotein n=1 Tax=Phaeospirillum tilakii TaxID=741673 RepID=A0ABW5CDM3_9PROT